MNTDKGDMDTSLEAHKVSYTKNSIAEMNTAKMSVVFKEDSMNLTPLFWDGI